MSVEWAAGLFEGEGCIYYKDVFNSQRRRHYKQQTLKLSSVDRDVVEKFAVAVESSATIRTDTWNHDKNGCQVQYIWATSSRSEVLRVIKLLLPYFCARRAAKAQDLLNYIQED